MGVRGGVPWLCGSQDGARPAAGRRLRLLLPLVALLPRLLVLAIVPHNVAADPAALRLATGYGLPPIPDGGPLVLGLPTVKSQLDRRRLSVAGIVVGEDSPHVGAQLDAAASRYLAAGHRSAHHKVAAAATLTTSSVSCMVVA